MLTFNLIQVSPDNHHWITKDVCDICKRCGRCKMLDEPLYNPPKKYKKWSKYKIIY